MSQPSPTFVSNALKLTSGSVFAQGIGVLATPIIARLFPPEAFGIAALFTSITAVLGALACLRYELSIMLPETEEEASNLFGLSLFAVLVVSVVTALVVYLTSDFIVTLLNAPKLEEYFWMIPLAVLINGLFLAFNYWSSRIKKFGQLSVARILSSAANQTTRLGAGFAGFISGGALIVGSILGNLVFVVFLGFMVWRSDRFTLRRSIRCKGMIAGLKRYSKFPIYGIWSMLMNSVSQQLPMWILAFYFSPQIVGYFALGRAVLTLPMNMVGTSLGQVFYQKAAEAYSHTGDLPRIAEEVFKRLVSLSILPLLILTLIGKEVFIVAFGNRWAEAGIYAQIIGPSIFFQFIASPISTIYCVLEKQRGGLIFDIVLVVTRAMSLICGGLLGNAFIALMLFSGSGVIVYWILALWLLWSAGVPLSRALAPIPKYAAISVPMLGLTLLAKWSAEISPLGVAVIGVVSSLPYYLVILKMDPSLQSPFRALVQKLRFVK